MAHYWQIILVSSVDPSWNPASDAQAVDRYNTRGFFLGRFFFREGGRVGGGGKVRFIEGMSRLVLDIFPPQGGVCFRGWMIKELLLWRELHYFWTRGNLFIPLYKRIVKKTWNSSRWGLSQSQTFDKFSCSVETCPKYCIDCQGLV